MKPLYLDWNLGLGDAIICNGLVRWLVREREVMVPAYAHNLASVKQLFADLDNVWVVGCAESGSVCVDQTSGDARHVFLVAETLSIGMNDPLFTVAMEMGIPFDQAFYDIAGVPFDAKWDLFHVPESGREIDCTGTGLPVVHEDRARGFMIDRHKGGLWQRDTIEVSSVTPRITDWRAVLSDAAEIHCIDSAVMHLAELLPTTGKLFYHRYARPASERQHVDAVFRKPWEVID